MQSFNRGAVAGRRPGLDDTISPGDTGQNTGQNPTVVTSNPSALKRSMWTPTCKLNISCIADPANAWTVLFNPTDLGGSLSAKIGRLEPIGWSSPVKQYACTGEIKIPIKLWLSSLAMRTWPPQLVVQQTVGGKTWTDVRDPLNWLLSLFYADAPGLAPPLVRLNWPGTIDMQVNFDDINWRFLAWDNAGTPRFAEIELTTSEVAEGFRSRACMVQYGLQDATHPGANSDWIRTRNLPPR
jgi:hypothetical protein